jgi:hypothetical protein
VAALQRADDAASVAAGTVFAPHRAEDTIMSSTMQWLNGLVAFLPNLLAGLAILGVGYVIAVLLGRLTRAVLSRTGYDRLLGKLGVTEADQVAKHAGSHHTGTAVFWLVLLAAVMQAARALNLGMIGDGIARVIAYVPHLVGAALIFAAALYVGNWARDRIAKSEAAHDGAGQRPFVGSSVRAGILAFGAFMALRELQIAHEIVTIAFGVTVAGIALAAALAFGLGGRGIAGQVAQQWFDKRHAGNGAKREISGGARP